MSLPAAVRGVGTSIGFPDVCNTPAPSGVVPIPYPNTGTHALAQGASESVKILGMSAITTATTLSATQGDEAGSAMGTTSGTVSSTGAFTSGSPTVYVDGLPAVRLTSSTTGNNMNNSVGIVAVPGAATVLFGFDASGESADAAATPDRSVDEAEIVRLADAVSGDRMSGAETMEAITSSARDGALVVRIDRFTSDAARRFYVAYAAALPVSAVVVDLRACTGGDLDAALELAGAFVDEGTPILAMEDGDGDIEIRRARGGAYVEMPVTLLVGAATKSAGEAFAMALEGAERARVVGGPTFGKHTAQRLAEDGSRLATAVRFRPAPRG